MCCSVSPFCPPVTRRRCDRSRFSRFFSAPGSTPQIYPSMVPDPAKRIRLDVVPVISSWRRFLISWAVCPQSLCRVLSARRETAPRVGLPGVCPVCLLGSLRSPGDGLPPPGRNETPEKIFSKNLCFLRPRAPQALKSRHSTLTTSGGASFVFFLSLTSPRSPLQSWRRSPFSFFASVLSYPELSPWLPRM